MNRHDTILKELQDKLKERDSMIDALEDIIDTQEKVIESYEDGYKENMNFHDGFEDTFTSSPDGTIQFETNYLKHNTKYDIYVIEHKEDPDG